MINKKKLYHEFELELKLQLEHTVQGSNSSFSFSLDFEDWSHKISSMLQFLAFFLNSTAPVHAMQADTSTRLVMVSQHVPSQDAINFRRDLDRHISQEVAEATNQAKMAKMANLATISKYVADVVEAKTTETKLVKSMARIITEVKIANYMVEVAETKVKAKANLAKAAVLAKKMLLHKNLFHYHYHYHYHYHSHSYSPQEEPFRGVYCMARDASGRLLKNSAGQPYPVFKSHAELKNQPIPQLALQTRPSLKQAIQKTVIYGLLSYGGYKLYEYFWNHYFSRQNWPDLPPHFYQNIELALDCTLPNLHPDIALVQHYHPIHGRYFKNNVRKYLLRSPNRRRCRSKIQTLSSPTFSSVLSTFYKSPTLFYYLIDQHTDKGQELRKELDHLNGFCGNLAAFGFPGAQNISLPRLITNFTDEEPADLLNLLFNRVTLAFWEYLGEETPNQIHNDLLFAHLANDGRWADAGFLRSLYRRRFIIFNILLRSLKR